MYLQRVLSFFFIFTILILGLTFAQLGEVAGPVSFIVNISSSQTLQIVVINSGSTSISYKIILPTLKAQQVNSTNPIVTSPSLNGTIKPYGQVPINITVYVPSKNNKPGYSWTGIVQVIETTNQTNAGGAVVQSGVAKIISITATEPKALNPLIYIVATILIICIIGIGYKKLLTPKHRPIKGLVGLKTLANMKSNNKLSAGKRVRGKAAKTKKGNNKTARTTKKKIKVKRKAKVVRTSR